ncbi:MAG TPA: glycosyltransferase family 39 protein [Candidatus Baltobacteraceae bacterium]
MRWKPHIWALVLIVLCGAALRTYDIAGVPSELIVDELDLYNSAQSIATTGHDIDGTLMPFLYCSLTRNPPMYAVAGYASSLVFGKNPFGLRFPAILFGLAAILLMYGIALELTGRRDVALVTALLQATQPIFIHFSRVAWEPASELPFLLGGLYVALRAFRAADATATPDRISFKALALAALLLGLTAYTYMAGWFYALVLGGGVLALNARRLRSPDTRRKVLGTLAIWFVVAAPALWMWFFDAHTGQRTARIATFQYGVSLASLRVFMLNYLSQFRWSYLVTTGDPVNGVTWRYMVGFGAFFWWVIPAAALGLLRARRYVGARWGFWWVGLWLIAYPLGGALTNEGVGVPNAPRTLAGAPVFCLLAAIGIVAVFDFAKIFRSPRLVVALRAIFATNLALSVALFSLFYFTKYVHEHANAWDSGTAALFGTIRDRYRGYSRLCVSVRPAWYGPDTYIRYYLSDIPIQKIDNISNPACSLPGTMLAVDSDHPVVRDGFHELATIYDVDGARFALLDVRPR